MAWRPAGAVAASSSLPRWSTVWKLDDDGELVDGFSIDARKRRCSAQCRLLEEGASIDGGEYYGWRR
jgi:hypothetical protein